MSKRPKIRRRFRRRLSSRSYHRMLREAFGPELAAISELPSSDRVAAIERIWDLQEESPADKAWPNERGREPEHQQGWDASGTYRLDILRQVYWELVQAGKIKPPPQINER